MGYSVSHVLWLGSLDLFLRMSKATGWYSYLSTLSMNSYLVWVSTWWLLQAFPPFSVTVNSQGLCLTDSPVIPLLWDQNRGSHKATYKAGRGWLSSWNFFPFLENQQHGRDLSVVLCCPRGGQCGQCVVTPLTLPMQSVLVSVVQGYAGALASPQVLGFFQWCLVLE